LNAVVFDGRGARSSNGMFAKVEARPSAARTRMRMEMGWSSGLGPGKGCGGANGCRALTPEAPRIGIMARALREWDRMVLVSCS